MEKEKIIEKLKGEGYDEVYEWEDKPDAHYSAHKHNFDTKLVILEGELSIEIQMVYGKKILRPGEEMVIPKETFHAAWAGPTGCKYIVGEKHK
ncbi:MAG: hypothetical protein A3C88_01275 [Candidatus Yanofskybacteria bacterium RIFCSPHIGHO2_02_FULL_50_12]|uniref:Cupin 2 conserved barrel domain-containing protein n=1 Tax=Candidatus Yanofskybacteria bacterium RIFCSPHIGHO2_02_FULL_50_12 TaxID=1802685 RepID=A0A1F8FWM1_9BACT|nr:MAG: hypothetical protein A3C88_01275 [Candidatus Yanofskybacteria bacterium RIFCSPHIGHO2_02_FULL_50_12]